MLLEQCDIVYSMCFYCRGQGWKGLIFFRINMPMATKIMVKAMVQTMLWLLLKISITSGINSNSIRDIITPNPNEVEKSMNFLSFLKIKAKPVPKRINSPTTNVKNNSILSRPIHSLSHYLILDK